MAPTPRLGGRSSHWSGGGDLATCMALSFLAPCFRVRQFRIPSLEHRLADRPSLDAVLDHASRKDRVCREPGPPLLRHWFSGRARSPDFMDAAQKYACIDHCATGNDCHRRIDLVSADRVFRASAAVHRLFLCSGALRHSLAGICLAAGAVSSRVRTANRFLTNGKHRRQSSPPEDRSLQLRSNRALFISRLPHMRRPDLPARPYRFSSTGMGASQRARRGL